MCHDDPEALDLLDQAAQEKPGRRWNKQESGLIVDIRNNKEEERPRGDRRSEEYQTKIDIVSLDTAGEREAQTSTQPKLLRMWILYTSI